jgi:hypothetical protein
MGWYGMSSGGRSFGGLGRAWEGCLRMLKPDDAAARHVQVENLHHNGRGCAACAGLELEACTTTGVQVGEPAQQEEGGHGGPPLQEPAPQQGCRLENLHHKEEGYKREEGGHGGPPLRKGRGRTRGSAPTKGKRADTGVRPYEGVKSCASGLVGFVGVDGSVAGEGAGAMADA